MNDFPRQWKAVGAAVAQAVERVGQRGWYILGSEVSGFEQDMARFWGAKHVVGVANGMDAIEIGLRCLGITSGDKVLTTPLTAFATTLAIMRIGATPVYVDVDAAGLLDLAQVRWALREDPSIRAIVPVHLYGFSLDLDELERIQSETGVPVLEDCAQSIGASFGDRFAGTVGRCAATSFYPTKNLGAIGDGGALVTGEAGIDSHARQLRNYGQSSQYVHDVAGLNSRLDELQAAILRDAMLPQLQLWTDRRRETATRYLSGIRNPSIQLPAHSPQCRPVWHLFPIVIDPALRDTFRDHLHRHGIGSGIHYPSMTVEQRALIGTGKFDVLTELTQAKRLSRGEVSLPIHPFLTTAEIDSVIDICNRWQP